LNKFKLLKAYDLHMHINASNALHGNFHGFQCIPLNFMCPLYSLQRCCEIAVNADW